MSSTQLSSTLLREAEIEYLTDESGQGSFVITGEGTYILFTRVCTQTQKPGLPHGFRTMAGPCRAGRMPRGTPKAIPNTYICACTPIHGTHVSTWTFFCNSVLILFCLIFPCESLPQTIRALLYIYNNLQEPFTFFKMTMCLASTLYIYIYIYIYISTGQIQIRSDPSEPSVRSDPSAPVGSAPAWVWATFRPRVAQDCQQIPRAAQDRQHRAQKRSKTANIGLKTAPGPPT